MFYSQFILAKKGPLGTIWIAAHLERKLRKNQVAETDIGVTVDNILFPEVPIALRLSGHLLLGVVRIYSRQVNYLFNDCSETLGKIKQAFHAAAVDLPPEATTAPFHSITLPETFDFDELELAPDSESSFLHLNGKYVDHHVTTREQITLQDCIENNPYLGSSQFGLDERFGDGSYSSLGLDFDEEFWANKACSSSVASTSTPLLKEDTIVPPAVGENEVTHMDVDDPYEQALELELQKGKSIGEAVNTEVGQMERDNQLNTSIPAISLVPSSNEPAGLEMASRNDSDFAVFKHDTPGFHAYTPRVLEACTPDLNQEYCPPDEPSTPALADETSLPMYNDCNAESAGRFSPVMLGNTERNSFSELLPGSLSAQQVSCVIPWASSVQATRSPSAASFQGFPLQQATPAEMNREAFLTQKENGQAFSVKESAASASTAFQSFPQLTFMQQTSTPVSHEGGVFPTGTFSTSPEPSLPYLHQQDGNLSVTVNHQWAGTLNQEVYPRFQQQGLAVNPQIPVSSFGSMAESLVSQPPSTMRNIGFATIQQGLAVSPQNPVPSFGSMAESLVLQQPSTMRNIVASQVLASPFVPEASIIPLFSASSGSLLPMANVPPMGRMEKMDLDKEAAHETPDLAASKGLLWQSAAQQLNLSSSAAMPAILSSMSMGECETLRSAYDLQTGSSDFLLLQKDMSDERIPGLELERNKSFSAGTDGIFKEAILPALDKTPILREETPYTFTRAPFLSTHSLDSLPADDDVLASILGRRSKPFKVVSTPKAPKEPKTNVAKRPKRAPRVTPKKRKIDFDTVAVLHGDVIRQQLANAEDIRRERRKAPCTRREVWGFIRETEGQENFDEPTLPELSPDLHDLYHDVLHGPESRPLSSALNGAVKAKQTSDSMLIRSGESDCLADGVNSELDTRGDSHLLVDCMNKDSSRDVCMNEFVGSVENNSSKNFTEQLKEDVKVETTQTNPCGGSMEAEAVEKLNAEEISKPEADSEGLAGKEGDTNALPESQGPEDYILSSIITRETEANEQAEQIIGRAESTGQAQKDILASSLSENVVGVVGTDVGDEGIGTAGQKDVVGVVGADVGNQERAMAVQQDTETSEEKQQLSFGVHEQDAQEGEVIVLSKEAELKALDVPSDGKDAGEIPMSDGKDTSEALIVQVVDIDKGNVEGSDKLPTSNVSEEETNLCRDDEEMAAMECERDTDFLDEDNDVAYAEIDYSSDEQDASIQDDNGWSARSRNVGRYLKTVFEDMEGSSKRLEQGPTLGLERLLARKTKREAARMFFETLVLKTKDYIHVEQNIAYQDIHLYPRSKLMKTEF